MKRISELPGAASETLDAPGDTLTHEVAKASITEAAAAGRKRRRTRDRRQVLIGQVVVFGLCVAVMEVLYLIFGQLVMPSPSQVVSAFIQIAGNGQLATALQQTMVVFAIGFVLSAITGVAIGIVLGGMPKINKMFEPLLNAFNSTPRIAFIPLIIVWFGLETQAKIIVTWFSAVIPIIIYTIGGVEGASRDLQEMGRSFAFNSRQMFRHIVIPEAFPVILTGLRVGGSLAILGTIVAELYTAQGGLGALLQHSATSFEMNQYFAAVIVLMVVGVVVSKALRLLETHAAKWRVLAAEEQR